MQQQQARCSGRPAHSGARVTAALPQARAAHHCRRSSRCRRRGAVAARASASAYADPEPKTLFAGRSEHSPDIRVIEIPDTRAYPHQIRGGRILYLDDSSNIHSVHHPNEKRATGAYFDVLATLPCFLRPEGHDPDEDSRRPLTPPEQPIVILGLGAGTVALLMDGAYPGWFSAAADDSDDASAAAPPTRLVGWELDSAVVDVAREHMGLAPLLDSKALVARVDDALAEPPQEEKGACAGVVVDLFARGRLLPELKDPETWRRIVGQRLAPHPGARAIVNLGAGPVPGMPITPPIADALAALQAMDEAFGVKAGGGGVCAAALQSRTTSNLVAMTGPAPTRQEVNAAAALMNATGAPSELAEAAGRTAWRDAAAFVASGGLGRQSGGPPALPGMGPGGRRAHYGGGPGMGGPGRMRF